MEESQHCPQSCQANAMDQHAQWSQVMLMLSKVASMIHYQLDVKVNKEVTVAIMTFLVHQSSVGYAECIGKCHSLC